MIVTVSPVRLLLPPGLRRSLMLFTLRSGLPGTKIRMLTFSSDGDCVGGEPLLVRLARYWKQCATNPVPKFMALAPFFEKKLLVGEPSRSCHVDPLNAL